MMNSTKNVIDYYKYWETEAIKTNLDTKRHNFSVLCQNIAGDFNIGSIIRNANAFLAKEVFIYGRKQWDRRGAVGTHKYSNLSNVKEINELPRIDIIAIDNVDGALPIDKFRWPDSHFIMAFGEEQIGLTSEILNLATVKLYIPQYGSVRSLNVGCASAIAMYDYVRKLYEKT